MAVADTHNNPLNVKYGELTKKWVDSGDASVGQKASDKGNFLRFNDPQTGFAAAADLLSQPLYANETVNTAMRKWSGGGYGADVAGKVIPSDVKMSELTPQQRNFLIASMAKREGYTGGMSPTDTTENRAQNASIASDTPPSFAPIPLTPVPSSSSTSPPPLDTASEGGQAFLTAMQSAQERAAQLQQQNATTLAHIQSGGHVDVMGNPLPPGSEDDIGFMPKLLATVAALHGNMGPAIQLLEQKRKTALFAQWQPVQNEIDRLEAEGKGKDAIALSQKAMAMFGSRAPELAQALQKTTDRIRDDMISRRTLSGIIKQNERQILPGDIRTEALADAKDRLASNIPLSKEETAQIIDQLKLKTELNPQTGTVLQSTTSSPRVQQPGLQYRATPSQFDSPAGRELIGMTGLDAPRLTNLLNGEAVYNDRGELISTPENRAKVNTAWTQLQGRAAEQAYKAMTPGQQLTNDYMRAKRLPDGAPKYSEGDLAAGRVDRADVEDAASRNMDISYYQGAGQVAARTNIPYAAMTNPITIDKETGQVLRHVPPGQANRQTDAVVEYNDYARPGGLGELYQLRNRLKEVGSILTEANVPKMGDVVARLGSSLDRRLDAIIPHDEELTGQRVVQTLAKDVIEQHINPNHITASRYRTAIDQLTSPDITVQGAIRVLQRLDTALSQDLNQYVQQGGRPINVQSVPPALRQERPVIQRREIP